MRSKISDDFEEEKMLVNKKFSKEDIKKSMFLYGVTDRHWLKEEEKLVDKVRLALLGGATFIQLREKNMDREEMKQEAIEIRDLCREFNVPFVVNDDVLLAKEIDADGVHVGQEDMEAIKAREILGEGKIIGVSAQTVEEAIIAEKNGATYLGVGAVFPTGSKDDAIMVSKETLKAITKAVSIPVVAIGGISKENVTELAGCGLDGISVISAIFGQEDIEEATKELKKKTKKIVES